MGCTRSKMVYRVSVDDAVEWYTTASAHHVYNMYRKGHCRIIILHNAKILKIRFETRTPDSNLNPENRNYNFKNVYVNW